MPRNNYPQKKIGFYKAVQPPHRKIELESFETIKFSNSFSRFTEWYQHPVPIHENQHTAELSDTRLSYSIDTGCTTVIPENIGLTVSFHSISLLKRIEKMDVPCAYFEEIPLTSSNKIQWVLNDQAPLGLLKEIISEFKHLKSSEYSNPYASSVVNTLQKFSPHFDDLLTFWNTPNASLN